MMQYTYGAQQPTTDAAYTFQGGTTPSASPPPIPTGNPYNGRFQPQQSIADPNFFWGQLEYMGEPTFVDVLADIIQNNEDAGLFLADGGFQALSDIVKETIDNRLQEFFSGLVLIQEKGDDGTMIKVSAELCGDTTKAILAKTNSDLTQAITGISTSVKSQLLEPKQRVIDLHRAAANAQKTSGLFGSLQAELDGTKQPGAGSGALRTMINLGRMGAGMAPLPPNPPTR